MEKRLLKLLLVAAAAVFMLAVVISFSGSVSAHDDAEEYKVAGTKLGGLLYDKWYKIVDVEVSGDHPLYPTDGKKSGPDTFRLTVLRPNLGINTEPDILLPRRLSTQPSETA